MLPDEPTEGWKPQKRPQEVFGEVETYRNLANFIGGNLVAYSLLGFAWLFFSPCLLHGSEAFTTRESFSYGTPLAAASLVVALVVARPWVKVQRANALVIVRNPLTRVEIPVVGVEEISCGEAFFPVLLTDAGLRIRLFGLQQSTIHYMHGGSEELTRLQENLATARAHHANATTAHSNGEPITSRVPLSPPFSVLLAGWVAWVVVTAIA